MDNPCEHCADLLREDAYYGDMISEWALDNGLPVPTVTFPREYELVDLGMRIDFERSDRFVDEVFRWHAHH